MLLSRYFPIFLPTLFFLLKVYPDPEMDKVKGSLITINVETEFILTMEMRNKKVKGYITMVNAQAVLVDSKVGMMSQKVEYSLHNN